MLETDEAFEEGSKLWKEQDVNDDDKGSPSRGKSKWKVFSIGVLTVAVIAASFVVTNKGNDSASVAIESNENKDVNKSPSALDSVVQNKEESTPTTTSSRNLLDGYDSPIFGFFPWAKNKCPCFDDDIPSNPGPFGCFCTFDEGVDGYKLWYPYYESNSVIGRTLVCDTDPVSSFDVRGETDYHGCLKEDTAFCQCDADSREGCVYPGPIPLTEREFNDCLELLEPQCQPPPNIECPCFDPEDLPADGNDCFCTENDVTGAYTVECPDNTFSAIDTGENVFQCSGPEEGSHPRTIDELEYRVCLGYLQVVQDCNGFCSCFSPEDLPLDRTECFCQEDKSLGFQRVLCPAFARWSVQFDAYPQCDANGDTSAISEEQYNKCKGFLDDVQDGCGGCPCFNGNAMNPVSALNCECDGENNGDFPPPDPFNPTAVGVIATCGTDISTEKFNLLGSTDEDGNLSEDAFCSCFPSQTNRCLTRSNRVLSETEFMACYAQLDPLCFVAQSCPCFDSNDLQSAFDNNPGSTCFTSFSEEAQIWVLNPPQNPSMPYGIEVDDEGFSCFDPGNSGMRITDLQYNFCRDLLFTFASDNADCIACPCFNGDLPDGCIVSAMCMNNNGPIEESGMDVLGDFVQGDYGVNLLCPGGKEYNVMASVNSAGEIESSSCACVAGTTGCVADNITGIGFVETNACHDLLSPTCPPTQAPTVMDEECPCFTLVEVEQADTDNTNPSCQCISDEDGARFNCFDGGGGLDPAFAAFFDKENENLACRKSTGGLVTATGDITQQQYDLCVEIIETVIAADSGYCDERACACFNDTAPACIPGDNISCDIGGPFGCDVPPESMLGLNLTCDTDNDLVYRVFGEPRNGITEGSCSCPGDALNCFVSQVNDGLIPVDFNACFDVLNVNCPVTDAPTATPTTDECPCMDGYKLVKEGFKARKEDYEGRCTCNDSTVNGNGFVNGCLGDEDNDLPEIELFAGRDSGGSCSVLGPGTGGETTQIMDIGELAADACIRFLAETSSLFCGGDINWEIDFNPIRD